MSDKNHRHVHQTAEIGSQIQTQGNIAIVGNNIAIHQGNIDSQNGHVAIAAKDQLNVEEGRQTKASVGWATCCPRRLPKILFIQINIRYIEFFMVKSNQR